MENNSLIKRPVLDQNKALYLGFKAENYAEIFNT
jgi:arsenate reductase-like glutaredoxin family protein